MLIWTIGDIIALVILGLCAVGIVFCFIMAGVNELWTDIKKRFKRNKK